MSEIDVRRPRKGLFRVKVVDSCRIFSKTWSDTFRSVLVYGKGQESRNKNFRNRAKKIHLP